MTGISDRGVTSVGIGSVTAQIGPPAPGSPPAVPPPSASNVTATVLQVDTIREQLTLTLRA